MMPSPLASRVSTLYRRIEQLSALQGDEQMLENRIAQLERVLEFDRVAAHARAAVERAEIAASDVPYLVALDLLPRDVYSAVLDAIPPPVFFEGRAAGGEHVRVPLRLGPIHSIVTWSFIDEVVRRALSDVLVARFAAPLEAHVRELFPAGPPFAEWARDVTLIDGRLVRRTPGYAGPAAVDRPWELLGGLLDLAREQDGHEYGSHLASLSIPFRGNRALLYVGPPQGLAYAPIPDDAAGAIERYTYEFSMGPTRRARRSLDTHRQRV